MTHAADVVIAGAGIVGAACAHSLAREGLRVLVCEPAIPGGGATAAGMGHVVVLDDSPAELALTYYSRCLWHALAPELPPEAEFDVRGTLWIAADDEELALVRHKQHAQVLDARALYQAEPNLRPSLAGGVLVPDDAVLYAPAAFTVDPIRSAVAALEEGGVRLANGDRVSAAHTILATGTAITELLPWVPVRPRKGHLAITARYPGFVRHQLVELGYLKSAHGSSDESVAFNVQPRRTGQVLIGSSREFGAEDSAINHAILKAMLNRAQLYLPELGSCVAIRTWTGFRAATPDKLPLIGPWPEDETLYLATGHEGLGITTSLGTARLLVGQLTGSPTEIPFEPYLPERFVTGQSNTGESEQESAHGLRTSKGAHV